MIVIVTDTSLQGNIDAAFLSRHLHLRAISSPPKMQAIRIRASADEATPYSAENPAPPSALYLDTELDIPRLTHPGELLVRIRAATVTRDELTWPELYTSKHLIPGHDFAGSVVSVFTDEATEDGGAKHSFSIGDEIYGMTSAEGNPTWAEYVAISDNEAARKPTSLGWAESAAVPMSALTAWQALFDQAGVVEPELSASGEIESGNNPIKKDPPIKALITGASGAVGAFLVQLGSISGLHVVAASTSKTQNAEFLKSLGADEVVDYNDLITKHGEYDVIIDTVGGSILESCWALVTAKGSLVTIDSSSFDFVNKHQELRLSSEKQEVNALFFIVEPSRPQLEKIAIAMDLNLLQVFVAQSFPLNQAREAYEMGSKRTVRRGKIALRI